MSLNFEEQILEAAKSIASATAALVKSASAAQRELVAQGKVSQMGCNFHTVLYLDTMKMSHVWVNFCYSLQNEDEA